MLMRMHRAMFELFVAILHQPHAQGWDQHAWRRIRWGSSSSDAFAYTHTCFRLRTRYTAWSGEDRRGP